MKKAQRIILLLFILVVIVELVSRWLDNHQMEYFVKPLIMPLIALYFLLYAKKKSFKTIVLLAFIFSFVGDMLLMLAHQNEILFYAGVGGFFLAQVFYIITFLKYYEQKEKGFIRQQPAWLVLFLGYLVGILIVLFPGLDGFMRPVILIYGISLIGMSVSAFNRKNRVSKPVFNRVFIGSIFFVLSDTMIALNKFYSEFAKASFWIILTYVIAQTLILSGLLEEREPA